MILEEHVEEAVKSLAAANAAIIALVAAAAPNALVIRDYRDNAQAKAERMIVVHAAPAERLSPVANFYRVPVTAMAITHQVGDKSRAACEAIYQALMAVINGATATTLGAKLPDGSAVTIDGIVPTPGGEGADESHQFLAVKADIFATIAA